MLPPSSILPSSRWHVHDIIRTEYSVQTTFLQLSSDNKLRWVFNEMLIHAPTDLTTTPYNRALIGGGGVFSSCQSIWKVQILRYSHFLFLHTSLFGNCKLYLHNITKRIEVKITLQLNINNSPICSFPQNNKKLA